jgi:hypothetical protein
MGSGVAVPFRVRRARLSRINADLSISESISSDILKFLEYKYMVTSNGDGTWI